MDIRKIIALMWCLLALTSASTVLAQGKGNGKGGGNNKCTDVPIRVTLLPTARREPPSVLRGDGVSDTYQDGQDGVLAAIHFCSATYDATITTYYSSRMIGISFPQAVPDSSLTGEVAPFAGSDILVPFFFNIRNILCATGSCGDTFSTHMVWRLYFPHNEAYHLHFYPASTDSPDIHSPNTLDYEPDINLPNETSYVLVRHSPGTPCAEGGTIGDLWDVTAVNPSSTDSSLVQLGTLHTLTSQPKHEVHLGQYAMSFHLEVEALQCFSAP